MGFDSWLVDPVLSESSLNLDTLSLTTGRDVYLSSEAALELGISIEDENVLVLDEALVIEPAPSLEDIGPTQTPSPSVDGTSSPTQSIIEPTPSEEDGSKTPTVSPTAENSPTSIQTTQVSLNSGSFRLVSFDWLAPGDKDKPTKTPTPTSTPSPVATPTLELTPSLTATQTLTSTPSPAITPTIELSPVLTVTQTSPEIVNPLIPTENSTLMQSGPVTITYKYDKLNRLTSAEYSNGDYYYYGEKVGDEIITGYDAVGNRLKQETRVNDVVSNTTYTYDEVNRLKFVNGVEYLWDNNGNLLSDGVNTYRYDTANQLVYFSNASTTTATYQYTDVMESQ